MKSLMHGFGQTSLNGVYSIIFSQISIFCTTSLLADLSQKV